MSNILIITKHYPDGERDPSGVFVQTWGHMLAHNTRTVVTSRPGWMRQLLRWVRETDLVAAHWLWPAGYVALAVSLVLRVPLVVVLYGDPFMLQRHRWIRWAAWPILKRAKTIQVISGPCAQIMEDLGWKQYELVPVR